MQAMSHSRGPETLKAATNPLEVLTRNVGRIIGPSVLAAAALVAPNAHANETTHGQPVPSLSNNAESNQLLSNAPSVIESFVAVSPESKNDVFKIHLNQQYAPGFNASELDARQKNQLRELASKVNESINKDRCATVTATSTGFASDEDGRFADANLGKKSTNNMHLAYERAVLSKDVIMAGIDQPKRILFNVYAKESILTKTQIANIDTIAKSNNLTRSAQLAAYNSGNHSNLSKAELSQLDRTIEDQRGSTIKIVVNHKTESNCGNTNKPNTKVRSNKDSNITPQVPSKASSDKIKKPGFSTDKRHAENGAMSLDRVSLGIIAALGLVALSAKTGLHIKRRRDQKRATEQESTQIGYGYGSGPQYDSFLSRVLRQPMNITPLAKTIRVKEEGVVYQVRRTLRKSPPKSWPGKIAAKITNLNVPEPPGGAKDILYPIRTIKWRIRMIRHRRRIAQSKKS